MIPLRISPIKFQKPFLHRKLIIKPRAIPIEQITETSYFIGKNILLFTMFYCGLNYLYYKKINDKK
jgi:hypothetical protein